MSSRSSVITTKNVAIVCPVHGIITGTRATTTTITVSRRPTVHTNPTVCLLHGMILIIKTMSTAPSFTYKFKPYQKTET